MVIHVECEHCSRVVRVGVAHGGKLGRCPSCKEVFRVPSFAAFDTAIALGLRAVFGLAPLVPLFAATAIVVAKGASLGTLLQGSLGGVFAAVGLAGAANLQHQATRWAPSLRRNVLVSGAAGIVAFLGILAALASVAAAAGHDADMLPLAALAGGVPAAAATFFRMRRNGVLEQIVNVTLASVVPIFLIGAISQSFLEIVPVLVGTAVVAVALVLVQHAVDLAEERLVSKLHEVPAAETPTFVAARTLQSS